MFTWFRNLKILNKLLLGFLLIVAISVVAGIININTMSVIKEASQEIAREGDELVYFERLLYLIIKQQVSEMNYLISGNSEYLEGDEDIDEEVEKYISLALSIVEDEDEAEELREIEEAVENYEDIFTQEVLSLYASGDKEGAIQLANGEYAVEIQNVNLMLQELSEDAREDVAEEISESEEMIQIAYNLSVFGSIGLVLLGVLFSIIIARGITKPITHLRDVADKISLGDLNTKVSVDTHDEIGDLAAAFERMIAAVRFFASESESPDN